MTEWKFVVSQIIFKDHNIQDSSRAIVQFVVVSNDDSRKGIASGTGARNVLISTSLIQIVH